jgi:hypothetical protein
MRRDQTTLLLSSALLVAMTTGCGSISSVTFGIGGRSPSRVETALRSSPPPHAPAHGYRHKHHQSDGQQVELVFDSGLDVYVVIGIPGLYYSNGSYLRLDGDRWYASTHFDSDWERRDESKLPPGLQKKQKKAKKGHKHKKSHPAKGHW